MKTRILYIVTLAALSAAPFYGCSESGTGAGPSASTGGSGGAGGSGSGGAGGSGGTGGSSAKEDPDYTKAFPQDRVARLDITIAPKDWQAMVADMTDMAGEFGKGGFGGPPGGGGVGGGGAGGGMPGGGGMSPPPSFFDACNGLAADDACKISFNGQEIAGKCTVDSASGKLYCAPSGGPGGPGGGFGNGTSFLPHEPIYVECDVKTEDRVWHHVGIRFKGNSSLSMAWSQGTWKLPLRLKFDEYEDTYPETKDQRFYGFKSLSLSNGSQDSSLLRDKLGTEVFVNAGIPAPATAFYRIFIDHGDGPTYFGLYTGIEVPSDNAFMDTHFGGHKGNMYKPDGTAAQWATYDINTLGKENHEDAADYSDTKALFDALHADRTDAAAWRAGLEAHLNVDGFLHWLALNTVIQDWDSYGRMPHNYYVYADPKKDGRFQWIPWDHSFAFTSGQALSLGMTEVTDQWPLIRYLLDDPTYLATYRAFVAQAAQKEYEPVAMEKRFQAAHDMIKPYVVGAEGEIAGHTLLSSPADFDNGLAALIAHVKARQTDVANFLK